VLTKAALASLMITSGNLALKPQKRRRKLDEETQIAQGISGFRNDQRV
jgi:hypothetical protein